MDEAVEPVRGILTNRSGDSWPVQLDVSLSPLPSSELENETVTDIKLIAKKFPDGYYVLEFAKPVHRHVRIVNGKLMIRGIE
jgi:hypothetical protein